MPTIDVHDAFPGEPHKNNATRVWISDKAAGDLAHHSSREPPPGRFWKRLERFAKNGFKHYHGTSIEFEWDGVYRISDGTLFRLIGFYDDATKDFVIVDAFLKRGQKLSKSDRARVDAAAEIKKKGSWRKVTP